MLTKYLSEEERKEGQSRIYKFQAFNGIGFNFMGETPVYLLAIHFGATNIQLGYISSVLFLTGFILVILPRLLAGKNLVNVQAAAWTIRGLFVLLYLLLFFMDGQPAVLLILIVYTLFCSARMVGVVIWNPLVKMMTTTQDRGKVLAQGNIVNQSASVVSKLISFIITSFQFFTGVAGILLLQILGVIFNSAAAFQLKKAACRETVEYEKGRNLFVIFKESLSNKEQRFPLMLKWLSITVMVVNGLTIVFVRKEAGFGPNIVFLYTLIIALANIFSGLFGRTFADRIGSRPLLIGVNILLSLSYIVWMLLPLSQKGSLPVLFYFILGFFTNFFLLATNMLVARVVVNSMPENESFSYNSMINFVMAFFSFFSGIIGGVLIDRGQSSLILLPNNFSFLFFFAFLLSLVLIYFSLRLIDRGSLTPRETAAILFSLEGLRAYNYIGKINTIDDPVKKRTVIMSISQNNAPIATEELRTIISSPLSSVKGEAIKSLFTNPRPELLNELLREASDSGSYHQLKAVFALGAYESESAERVLLSLLDSSDGAVRSTAAKSLSRIGHTQSLERITVLSEQADMALDKINYLIALKNMDSTGAIFKKLFSTAGGSTEGLFRQTYYSLAADLLEMTPVLSSVYSSKNLKKGSGVRDFLDQTRDIHVFYRNHRNLIHWFRGGDWARIAEFCLSSLEEYNTDDISLSNPIGQLRTAVNEEASRMTALSQQEDPLLYDNALALVYFTYQILAKSPPLI